MCIKLIVHSRNNSLVASSVSRKRRIGRIWSYYVPAFFQTEARTEDNEITDYIFLTKMIRNRILVENRKADDSIFCNEIRLLSYIIYCNYQKGSVSIISFGIMFFGRLLLKRWSQPED